TVLAVRAPVLSAVRGGAQELVRDATQDPERGLAAHGASGGSHHVLRAHPEAEVFRGLSEAAAGSRSFCVAGRQFRTTWRVSVVDGARPHRADRARCGSDG